MWQLASSGLFDFAEAISCVFAFVSYSFSVVATSRFANIRARNNIIGTTMKWLYGTMDDNDRQNIEEHHKLVDTNNHMAISTLNRNIIINDHFNTTIQNIKKAIESDRKQISLRINSVQRTNQDLHRQLLHLDILLKVKILSDSIEHIQNNLTSARLNLMSSNILTNEEIDKYNIDAFKLENIELGVAVSAGNIIFSIKIPTNTTIAKHSFVTPCPNKNFEELQFKNEHILDINNTKYVYSKNLYIGNLKILNIYMCYKKKLQENTQ